MEKLCDVALFLVLIFGGMQVLVAAVYKVGDSAGWTTIGNVDYQQWAAVKTFYVGDIILFEYNLQFHNVMQVTHAQYKSCNATSPITTLSTGNDSITIPTHGHHYFLCGAPGHCQAGQKVDINVIRASSTRAPSPTLSNSSSVPALSAPAPSPSDATALYVSSRFISKLWLAIAVMAAFV